MKGWMWLFASATSLATVLLLAGAGSATAVDWSRPFIIPDASPANGLAMAASEQRGTLIAWEEYLGGGGGHIRARWIEPDGTLGPVRRMNTAATARPADWDFSAPYVAANRSGTAVVAWHGPRNALFARSFGRGGRLGPILELAPENDIPGAAHMTIDAAGAATVAWSQIATEYVEPKGSRIVAATAHARRIHADGSLGATIDLPAGENLGLWPQLASHPSGKTTVIWLTRTADLQGVRMARISNEGLGPVREIAARGPYASAERPVFAAGPAGGSVIAWQGSDAAGPGLMARRIAADGTFGQPHMIERGSAPHSADATLAPDGPATVVWRQVTADSVLIRARQIADDDSLQPPLTLTDPALLPGEPDVEPSPSGGTTTIWGSQRSTQVAGGYDNDAFIETREIATNGSLRDATALTSGSPPFASDPRLAASRGELTAVWLEWHGNSSWVSASRLVSHCPSPRPTRALVRVLKQRRPPRAPGVHATLSFDRAVELRFVRAVLTYRRHGGTRRSVRVLHPRGLGGPARYPLFLGTTRAVRRDLDRGSRAWVRVVVRTRSYRTGCDFGKPQVVRLAARVR
jgi:hypothetical protein